MANTRSAQQVEQWNGLLRPERDKVGSLTNQEIRMNPIAVVGIDLAKHVFQVRACDSSGTAVSARKLSRGQVIGFFAKLPPCLVGMEACSSAHYWARRLTELGHTVRLMPPQYVKPYVKTNKNDARDAEAICEAVTRPNMRFVPIKTEAQQAVLVLQRDGKADGQGCRATSPATGRIYDCKRFR